MDTIRSAVSGVTMIGRTIGKYRFVEQIGRGGMGTVYKALDETLDREVAIKMLNPDLIAPETAARFRSEAVTLARLSHPCIASIHELSREGHDLLMVMEFVPGETCEKLLKREGPLPVRRAVVLCGQLLDALDHAHRAGIVHRDLKPSNLMVTPSGTVKVMDFGVARVMGSEHLTSDGFMVGTPAYMAPEQVRGDEVDQRTDLYAAAVVFYRLLTNRLPFEADSAVAIIQSQLNDPPTPPRQFRADLPEWIETILARGMSKTPADRFQTAAEFRAALEHGLAGGTSQFRLPASYDENQETVATPTPIPMRTNPAMVVPNTGRQPSAPREHHSDTTVTLKAQHLAVVGGLLVLLIVAVGVLAYAALRRPITAIVTPALQSLPGLVSQSSPPSANAAPVQDVQKPATETASVSNPGATDAASAPKPAADSAPPPPPRPVPPSTPAAGKAASVDRIPPPPPKAPAVVPTAGSTPPPAASVESIPPVSPVDPTGSKATGAASTQSFGDVKTLVTDGSKSKDIDVLLSLEPGRLAVHSRDSGAVFKTFPYKSILAATYSQSRRPRWNDNPSLAPIPKDLGGSGFFLKSSKHWLTLQSQTEYMILRLDDKNVTLILSSLEQRTGTKVQRLDGDKE